MSVNREEIKRLIDRISEKDAKKVLGFLEKLGSRIENQTFSPSDLSEDKALIDQIIASRKDRESGRIYNKEEGLEYLRENVKGFERKQYF
ncbi:MAG: hypothetical protein LRY73_11485 [Bacillus sp. (in: Bacteria)]|nr:hypothetical protein [Bacillus sp. (in: firmicutes)]